MSRLQIVNRSSSTMYPTMAVRLPCANCRKPLYWDAADLSYQLRMLEQGERVAPACNDDCAAESKPWTKRRLRSLIAKLAQAQFDVSPASS